MSLAAETASWTEAKGEAFTISFANWVLPQHAKYSSSSYLSISSSLSLSLSLSYFTVSATVIHSVLPPLP